MAGAGGADSWDPFGSNNFDLGSQLEAPPPFSPGGWLTVDWLDSMPSSGAADPYLDFDNSIPQHHPIDITQNDSLLFDGIDDAPAMAPPPLPRSAQDEAHHLFNEGAGSDLDMQQPPAKKPRLKTKGPPPSDWKRWKETIGDLYLKQDKTLEETRQVMKDSHGFDASSQTYKEKFSEWNFKKYIPQKWTGKMTRLADQRQPKDTVFELGPRKWTADEIRKKRGRSDVQDEHDSPTLPTQLIIRTPSLPSPQISHDLSRRSSLSSPLVQFQPLSSLSQPRSSLVLPPLNNNYHQPWTTSSPHPPTLPPIHAPAANFPWLSPVNPRIRQITGHGDPWLSFRVSGQSLTDLEHRRSYAKGLISQGEIKKAVEHLREVLSGFQQLLGPTHNQTVDTAYQFAEILHRDDKIDEASSVLNWMSTTCVRKYGTSHEKTITHYIKTINLLRTWSRNDDAELLVRKLVESLDDVDGDQSAPVIAASKTSLALTSITDGDLDAIFSQLEESGQLDSQIRLLRILTESSPEKADRLEPACRRIIVFCEHNLDKHILQHTRAYQWLARLHCLRHQHERVTTTLQEATMHLEKYFSKSESVSMDLMREVRGLAFLHPDHAECDEILQMLTDLLETRVEYHLRGKYLVLVEFLISVGVMWQQKSWESAMPWFERALAVSSKAYGWRHPMTQRLEKTLEKHHFDASSKVFDIDDVWMKSFSFLDL